MPHKHIGSRHSSSQKVHHRNLTWLWIGLGVLVLTFVAIWLFTPKTAAPADTGSSPARELTTAEAYQKYLDGVFFLDVRTQDEWNDFHLKGSTLIPLDELDSRYTELPKDREIVVVCRSGHRSASAVALLQGKGFTNLASLSGGLQAWVDADYPVER